MRPPRAIRRPFRSGSMSRGSQIVLGQAELEESILQPDCQRVILRVYLKDAPIIAHKAS